jgi:hypothetical protein
MGESYRQRIRLASPAGRFGKRMLPLGRRETKIYKLPGDAHRPLTDAA